MSGLTDSEINAFLRKKVKHLIIMPAQSYEELFSVSGIPQSMPDSIMLKRQPWACCINTDKAAGPGLHWVALIVFPQSKQVFYYDSLLPNREYMIPTRITLYFQKMAAAGCAIYQNSTLDQHNTMSVEHHRLENTMCGAYACGIIVIMDHAFDARPEVLVSEFYNAHKRLRETKKVFFLFREIKHS